MFYVICKMCNKLALCSRWEMCGACEAEYEEAIKIMAEMPQSNK